MAWGYGSPPSDQRLLQTADYVVSEWMKSPLWQKLLAMNASGAAAAADARLAAGIAQIRNASLLVGSAELALTLGVPLAAWVGAFAALGAPYLEARNLVRNENFQSGFSRGFVAGISDWEWQQVTSRFFVRNVGPLNPFDESLTYIAANAGNDGLRAGYVHACGLNGIGRKAILSRLRSLSPSTRPGQWNPLDQRNYIVELAAAWRGNNIFQAA